MAGREYLAYFLRRLACFIFRELQFGSMTCGEKFFHESGIAASALSIRSIAFEGVGARGLKGELARNALRKANVRS